MRIVKVVKVYEPTWGKSNKPVFYVVYTMRGRGNKHFETELHAIDEMDAYRIVRSKALANEETAWVKNVEEMELLHKQFPNSGYEKELAYAKKVLRAIRKEMGV